MSWYCLDKLPVLMHLTLSACLLLRSRIRVIFTDHSCVARSTCVRKEGIVGTDLGGIALLAPEPVS